MFGKIRIKGNRFFCFLVLLIPKILAAQNEIPTSTNQFEVTEKNNSIFKNDKFWRGADGAATIDLENGKILWLFSSFKRQ